MKSYIKLNNNNDHLSLGNLFRIIKSLSKNKTAAKASEVFCTLFEVESINDTTVNNYCVGCRGIGNEYKQIYINKERKYHNNKEEFTDILINLLSIIDGQVYIIDHNKIHFINNNESAQELSKKLYNLSKNDKYIPKETKELIGELYKDHKTYELLIEEIIYIVLYKKQPIYEDELKREVIENVLSDTSISSNALQEYLSLKLREGINYYYSLKKLANEGNTYALFELGTNEYYGYTSGTPRYDKAYEYLINAANNNHAAANNIIGNMYLKGEIGNKSQNDLLKGYDFIIKAFELGNIAAANTLGKMYLNGIFPLEKDEQQAINYFNIGIDNNYAYSYNNMGIIYEKRNDLKQAFNYYKKSAELGESWACNKVGEYYRKGIIEQNNHEAYKYYNQALDNNSNVLCYYAYYNLAKYYYLNGCEDIVLVPNKQKALRYLEEASNHNIYEATIEIFYYYIEEYLNNKDKNIYDNIIKYKTLIENNPKYDLKIKELIEKQLYKISNKPKIDLSIIE